MHFVLCKCFLFVFFPLVRNVFRAFFLIWAHANKMFRPKKRKNDTKIGSAQNTDEQNKKKPNKNHCERIFPFVLHVSVIREESERAREVYDSIPRYFLALSFSVQFIFLRPENREMHTHASEMAIYLPPHFVSFSCLLSAHNSYLLAWNWSHLLLSHTDSFSISSLSSSNAQRIAHKLRKFLKIVALALLLRQTYTAHTQTHSHFHTGQFSVSMHTHTRGSIWLIVLRIRSQCSMQVNKACVGFMFLLLTV